MRYQIAPMGVVRFGLLGFPIHVQPGFWVVALLLVGSKSRSLTENLALVAIVFASILVHELGHAFVARRAGLSPMIVVHAFGGMTRWLPLEPLSRGRAIGIAIAGPAAGLLLAVASLVVLQLLPRGGGSNAGSQLRSALVILAQINGFWSLVNLLPIMPFDGGQILSQWLGPKRRLMAARISLVVGCITALLLFRLRLFVAATVFFAAAIIQFVMFLRSLRGSTAVDATRIALLLNQAQRALEGGDAETAAKAAEVVIELSNVLEERRKAAEIFAWAALGRGQLNHARRVFGLLKEGPLDPLLQAAILEADGDAERAIACLRQARVAGDERPQLAASLVRLLLSADRYGEAALTTIQILDDVTEDEARQVVSACRDGGRPVPAAELGLALYTKTLKVDDLAWAIVDFSTSGSQDAVEKALGVAVERQVTAQELCGSPAFATIAADGELRRQVGGLPASASGPSV